LVLKGAYAEAATAFQRGLATLGQTDDIEAARIEVQIGHLHYRRGEYAAARKALMAAVEIGTRLGVDDVSAEGLKLLGLVSLQTRDLGVAADFMQRSRALYERLEDVAGLADIHSNLGMIYRRTAHWDAALAEYQASLALRERMGHLGGIGTCYNNIAEVHRTRGELRLAIEGYQRAIETWAGIGNASGVAVALIGLGAARVEMGEVTQGRADLLDAKERFSELGSTFYLPDLYRYLASAELAVGDLEAAEQAAGKSLEYARAGEARHQEAATLRVLAEISLARGEAEAARALLEISRQTLRELGDMLELERTEAAIRRLES
jgi:tetratricopeptide (TPR) repeat protein